MKSISVKVNDSVQTIAQTEVVTKDSQPTVIKATRNANYELINDATGYAPDHIVTKRVGKDLHISFEDDAKESDLIIKDFYDYDKSALIGQAESGQYHYYVPDTGLTQDYVTELVIGDIEGQALGGQGYPAPWWIGAEEGSRFGVMPWLIGIAGLAGIAAVVSGRDDKGNDNNNNANASAQEKPLNIENIQSDTVAQGATQALNFTVTSNGQNVSQAIISVNGTELKDANNKTVLTDKDGKVNITAQLLEANGIKLGELPNFTISAKKEHYAQATATLHNPEVVTMDGGVVVTPHESATELEVTYTKPDQTVSTAKFIKNTNGDGKAGAWIDNNKDDSVTIDPATGKVVIPVNTIGSKTNVTAKQTTDVGTTNNSKGVSDILSAKPVVEAIKTGDDAGNVVIKPSDDAINGSKVVVSYTDADGKSNTATIAKDNNGKWTSNDNKVVIGSDGTITIPADRVKDGSDVTANQTTNNGKSGDSSATVADAPDNTFKPQTGDKDITITVAGDDIVNKAEADKATVPVAVKVASKDGETVTGVKVTVNGKDYPATKDANGDGYTAQVPSADIKADKAKTATATVTLSKAGKTGIVTDTENYTVDTQAPAKPATPDMTAATDTGVSDTDNNTNNNKPSFTVQTPAVGETPVLMVDGNPVEAEVTKNNGTTTLTPKQSISDGDHKVSVAVTDSAGNTSEPSDTLSVVIDTKAPTKPEVTIGNGDDDKITNDEVDKDGNVTVNVKLPDDAKEGDIVVVNDDKGTSLTDDHIKARQVGVKVPAPVKDNTYLTAEVFIKDKAGNQSENASEVFQRDNKPLTASISVTGDKGKVTVATAKNATVDAAATIEDKNSETGLTYTVTFNRAVATEQQVTVKLSGAADADDIESITWAGKEENKGNLTYDKSNHTVTITVPKGESSASFFLNPKQEPTNKQYNYEGQETVIATLQNNNGYQVNAEKSSATGVILDGNPVALQQLDGDITLYYGLQKDSAKSGRDFGYTVAVDTHESSAQSPILMTDFADSLYVGYFSDGTATRSQGNIANYADTAPARTATDNSASITTVDMGASDDTLWVRGSQTQATCVYLGEGDDTYTLGGIYSSLNTVRTSANIFAEAGNDTVTIGGNVSQANIYMGSGSDTLTIKGNLSTSNTIDMGSGKSIDPSLYQRTYKANNKSLGNDDNIDKPSDVNHLNIDGSISGGTTILGGAGKDHVNLNTYRQSLSLSQLTDVDVINLSGTGNNTLTDVNVANVTKNQGLYIQGGRGDTVNIGHSGLIN